MIKKCFIAIAFLLIFMFLTTKDQLLLVLERIVTLRYPIYYMRTKCQKFYFVDIYFFKVR